jgi:HSP90 family molecular chaperone
VYINAIDKEHSSIEIFDDGIGMNDDQIKNYVTVGFNRREKDINNATVMGRKGIGKLAALYLSNNYYIYTKTKQTNSTC